MHKKRSQRRPRGARKTQKGQWQSTGRTIHISKLPCGDTCPRACRTRQRGAKRRHLRCMSQKNWASGQCCRCAMSPHFCDSDCHESHERTWVFRIGYYEYMNIGCYPHLRVHMHYGTVRELPFTWWIRVHGDGGMSHGPGHGGVGVTQGSGRGWNIIFQCLWKVCFGCH